MMEDGRAGSSSSKRTACVTGGTGYIGSMLVKTLLERGYAVRATVRDPDNGSRVAHLKALGDLGELSLFRADLGESGSFDDAVDGCDYVFHVAMVDNVESVDPDTVNNMIESQVEGTLNVLRSCLKAKSIRRVIFTSTGGAVSANRKHGIDVIFDEESWSDVEYLATEKPPIWGYLVSKTNAEKEAWKFAKEHNIDLISMIPTLVIGQGLSPQPPITLHLFLSFLNGDKISFDLLNMAQKVLGSIPIVHVKDVCRAYIFLVETTSASGRYIVNQIDTSLQDLANFLQKRYPQYQINYDFSDVSSKSIQGLSSEKIRKVGFNFEYETFEDIYDDIVEYRVKSCILPINSSSLS